MRCFIKAGLSGILLVILACVGSATAEEEPGLPATPGQYLATGGPEAPHRGVYEVPLRAKGEVAKSFLDLDLTVTFTRPDGSRVSVDGFYDGDSLFKARAYCDTLGDWSWTSSSGTTSLNGQSGRFRVMPSSLPGKLRKHLSDPHQFAYDNGQWFLHLGDTGYRYLVQTEPIWKEYIDQAAAMGATKVRTWLCQSRGGVEALFTEDRSGMNLLYWQEIDRRVTYALNHHPQVILKLILYGEDTAELLRYGQGDKASRFAARYAQARFSAFPNVMWCISNDREIVANGEELRGRRVPAGVIDQIGRGMAGREPWGTLLTNHQSRRSGYAFVQAPWSDVITLEDLDQVDGQRLLEYRAKGDDPVVNDEDRYELYRGPKRPRYFFRRLMWASLLSGGQATYGGLMTYEPYDGGLRGVQGYYDARREGKLAGGADDFRFVHQFFRDARLTLVGMNPDDALAGRDPRKVKCIHDATTYIVYLANPDGSVPETADAATVTPMVSLTLPRGRFTEKWFQPTTGDWHQPREIVGGKQTLAAPGPGDWVLVIRVRQS